MVTQFLSSEMSKGFVLKLLAVTLVALLTSTITFAFTTKTNTDSLSHTEIVAPNSQKIKEEEISAENLEGVEVIFDYEGYQNNLAMCESSNNAKAENELGFIGLYQMGEAALVDAGYYHAKSLKPGQKLGEQYNNDWTGTWTGKNGINIVMLIGLGDKEHNDCKLSFPRRPESRYLRSQG